MPVRSARKRPRWTDRARGAALLLSLLGVLGVCTAGERGVPAQQGILNFGKVSEGVYRGAQPDAASLKNLQQLGVKTIISLHLPKEAWKAEAAEAAANGIVYTNVPLRGLGRPTEQQVKDVLALLESSPFPVFVHCVHGCDRTGTIVACYRIQHDGWKGEAALQEAKKYGLSWAERGMKKFILEFATKCEKR